MDLLTLVCSLYIKCITLHYIYQIANTDLLYSMSVLNVIGLHISLSHTLNILSTNEQKLKHIAIIPRPPSPRTIIMYESHHITCVCIVLSSHMPYNQNQLLIQVRSAVLEYISLCSFETRSVGNTAVPWQHGSFYHSLQVFLNYL